MGEDPENLSQDTPKQNLFCPQRSLAHRIFLEAAERGHIDRDRVRELLWLINAPPDIVDIARVLENLSQVLTAAEEQWAGILELQNLEWLQSVLPEILNALKKAKEPSLLEKGSSPLEIDAQFGQRDWLDRNALYCALRVEAELPLDLVERYQLLRAHYFFAHTAWLVRNAHEPKAPTDLDAYEAYGGSEVWPALKVDPYHAGLCIRDMVGDSNNLGWASELLEKMQITQTPRQMPKLPAVTMTEKVDGFNVQKKVNYLSDYLKQIYGFKDRRAGLGSFPRLNAISCIGDPDDPNLFFGILSDWAMIRDGTIYRPQLPIIPPPDQSALLPTTIGLPLGSYAERDRDDDDGVHTDEYEGEENDETFTGGLDCEDSNCDRTPGSFSGRIQGSIHQIVRQQKLFPFAIEQLSAKDLADLHSEVPYMLSTTMLRRGDRVPLSRSQFRRPLDTTLKEGEEIEAYVFLLAMLWTGSEASRAESFLFAKNEGYLGDSPLAIINDGSGSAIIRIRVPFPEYRSEQYPVPELDCDRTEYIYLPDSANLALAVESCTKLHGLRGDRYPVFPGKKGRLPRNARVLLKAWAPSGRLTLNKITSTLFGRVMSLTGNDYVAATMITGKKHRLSNVAMHYACREMSPLQDIYSKTVRKLMAEIPSWGQLPGSSPSAATDNDPSELEPPSQYQGRMPRCLGRRLCPRTEKFQLAIGDLMTDLDNKPHFKSSDEDWISYHNLYTFYTVWMFALATGVRKMITPYLDINQISPINRIATLRDKDGDSGTKAKLIWIPDLVFKQMQNYAKHLKYICKRFRLGDTDLPCFFLKGNGCPQEVRPKTQFDYVNRYLPGFPVDIHRRFMFNCLLDFGCPSEIARVWMGHALAGEEWWADEATFSHRAYRQQLSVYLVLILKYLGLKQL